MEPDVARMYSSSPPPLDDGAEEDDEEFGDFGGFSGVPSSVSFTEFDTPSAFGQSQTAADTSPPTLCENGSTAFTDLGPRPFGRGSLEDDSASSDTDALGADSCSSRDSSHPCKVLGVEDLKKLAGQAQPSLCLNSDDPEVGNGRTADDSWGCNGGSPPTEVVTNGFGMFDVKEASLYQASPHSHKKEIPMDPILECHSSSPADEFADFSAFSNADKPVDFSQAEDTRERRDDFSEGKSPGSKQAEPHARAESAEEDLQRRIRDTGMERSVDRGVTETLSNGEQGLHTREDFEQRDMELGTACQGSKEPVVQNDGEPTETEELDTTEGMASLSESEDRSLRQDEELPGVPDDNVVDGVSDSNEDYGDFGRTDFSSSPTPCAEEMGPPGSGRLAEDPEDEDFGEFGHASTCSREGFEDFDQVGNDDVGEELSDGLEAARETADVEAFGDVDHPKDHSRGQDSDDGEAQFGDFPGSDSFADFSSAPAGADPNVDTGWNAFGGHEQGEGDSWAAFGQERSGTDMDEHGEHWQGAVAPSAPPSAAPHAFGKENPASLASRLERLFRAGFPSPPVPELDADQEVVYPLRDLFEPLEAQEEEEERSGEAHGGPWRVWQQLQDIHNAFGLRHQWGGSHSNKALLCSLGIDTRNILFTGQKKQPVIVPMYAAGLGMLEPTKEPAKPISAAEKIASIAQAPPASQEMSVCPSDPSQEALPPVQFDWSSSGLTNPLDASGGSSLLNLDFFGPVEDSGCISATSIPGVDPELYELTTAKMDTSSGGSRVADAFARLMSTVEKTSTSTRKPRKEENLSEEAAKVIASLPDLSFMHAKVLMFPATLTPLGTSAIPTSD